MLSQLKNVLAPGSRSPRLSIRSDSQAIFLKTQPLRTTHRNPREAREPCLAALLSVEVAVPLDRRDGRLQILKLPCEEDALSPSKTFSGAVLLSLSRT